MVDDNTIELDRFGNARHPRDAQRLFGQDRAEAQFLAAYQSGRMPHAWLMSGPEGIGKSSFSYRAARFILAHPDPNSAQVQASKTLDTDPDLPSNRRISAQSHGDLLILRREIEAGKKTVPTEIRVDQVRKAIQFFTSTANEGGWRIAIIDPMDELNRSGANALLKLIEEPPQRVLFFMVTGSPGSLLPTIRSRCRVLQFHPLTEPDLVSALLDQPNPTDRETAKRAARFADGSVRQALKRLEPATLGIIDHVETLLRRLPVIDRGELFTMADGLTGRDKTSDYETVIDTVHSWLGEQCRSRAGEGARRLAPLAEVWEKSARAARETDRYNLDRRPFLLTLFADLAEAVRLSQSG